MRYVIGLDLGTRQDYSALIVEEHRVEVVKRERPEHWHDVRHIERFHLDTTYSDVVEAVVSLVTSAPLHGHRTLLAVDATGVGRPIVEALSARLHRQPKLTGIPITITGGDASNSHSEGGWRWWNVPKRDLVSSVALALEQERRGAPGARRLQVAASLEEAKALVDELRSFRVTITAAANDTYGAWRERDHDDLVLAVACAVWAAEREWHPPARISRPTGSITDYRAGDLMNGPRFTRRRI